MQTVGIIGAGKLGITLAQLAVRAGYRVLISGSGDPGKIRLAVDVLAPGAVSARSQEVAESADIIILALPLGKFHQLPPQYFADKLVIDAMNYWWEVDGPRSNILPDDQSSSEYVQTLLPTARVIKALSHMGYHDLYDEARDKDQPGRKAIALAGDNTADIAAASELIDSLGFDPLPIGPLAAGHKLEPGGPAFGVDENIQALRQLLR